MPTEDANGDSTLNKSNDQNYYPPADQVNSTQLEIEQTRAQGIIDHLNAVKGQS